MPVLIKPFSLLLFILLLSFQTAESLQENQVADKADIQFHFVSKDVQGTIDGFKSEIVYDPEQIESSFFKGSVVVETIKTGNFLRDWSLKKEKYFNEDQYPRISFESNEVVRTDDGFVVKGALSLKGVSKNISIDFKNSGDELIGNFSIYTSDYGISIKSKREDNLVNVRLKFALRN